MNRWFAPPPSFPHCNGKGINIFNSLTSIYKAIATTQYGNRAQGFVKNRFRKTKRIFLLILYTLDNPILI